MKAFSVALKAKALPSGTVPSTCFNKRSIPVFFFSLSFIYCCVSNRLISVVDVVGPMNPYQPIPFHILSFDVFQSRILIYTSSTSSTYELYHAGWRNSGYYRLQSISQVCSSYLIYITSSWCLVDQLTYLTSTRWFIASLWPDTR